MYYSIIFPRHIFANVLSPCVTAFTLPIEPLLTQNFHRKTWKGPSNICTHNRLHTEENPEFGEIGSFILNTVLPFCLREGQYFYLPKLFAIQISLKRQSWEMVASALADNMYRHKRHRNGLPTVLVLNILQIEKKNKNTFYIASWSPIFQT